MSVRPRLLVLVSTFALALGLAPAANATAAEGGSARDPGARLEAAEVLGSTSAPRGDKSAVMRLGTAEAPERYVVQLADPAIAVYTGGIQRLQATRPRAGERLDLAAAPVRKYRAHLDAEQDDLRDREQSDLVVVRFGDKYKQWNAAFDAGYCAALGRPYVTLHGEDLIHPLKEVDAEAQAWCRTTDQVVQTLRYVLEA